MVMGVSGSGTSRRYCQGDDQSAERSLDGGVFHPAVGTRHLVPDTERAWSQHAMVGCPAQVAADTPEGAHASMYGEESWYVSGGLASSHVWLALPGRVLGHLGSSVRVRLRAVHD